MPLVFVHGVSVRAGSSYERQVRFRDAAFRQHVLGDPEAEVLNPYWGDIGAKAAWGHASLPGEPVLVLEALGPQAGVPVEQVLISEEASGYTRADSVLVDVARHDFREAIDLLVSTAIEESDLDAASLVSVATGLTEYAEEHPAPGWVRETAHDHAFLERLREETKLAVRTVAERRRGFGGAVRDGAALDDPGAATGASGPDGSGPPPSTERGGRSGAGVVLVAPPAPDAAVAEASGHADVWEAFARAVDRVREAIADWRWGQPGRSLRRVVQPYLTHFVGDILVYLESRGTPTQPGAIVERVAAAIEDAAAKVRKGETLLVVGHSMGGNIVLDVLQSFLPRVRVDALVTVGNQVGWFEEMKLFLASDPTVPRQGRERVPRPENVLRWLNVIDTSDYLAYAAAPIFEGVRDVTFSSGRGPLAAHTEYFKNVGFYRRLARWLEER